MLTWILLAMSLCALATLTCCCVTCSFRCDEDWVGASIGTDISTGSDCGWTEVAGDSEIASVFGNNLKFTTTLASAKCNATALGPNVLVFATVYTLTGSNAIRIMLDFVDNDNYLAAEFYCVTSGVSSSNVIRRTAGVESTIKSRNISRVFSGSEQVHMCVYYDGTTLLFTIGISGAVGTIMTAITSETVTSAEVAVGTGNTLTNAAAFMRVRVFDFSGEGGSCRDCFMGSEVLERHDSCNYFDVTFSGITGCSHLNNTFTLAITPGDPFTTTPTVASWNVSLDPGFCGLFGLGDVGIDFRDGGSGDLDITVTLSHSPYYIEFKLAAWAASYPTTGTDAISGLSIPYSTQSVGGTGIDGSAATCTITAVDPITA